MNFKGVSMLKNTFDKEKQLKREAEINRRLSKLSHKQLVERYNEINGGFGVWTELSCIRSEIFRRGFKVIIGDRLR